MRSTNTGITIEVHLGPDEWAAALRSEAAAGLAASPKELPFTWLYDERGCALFEAITELPEYYPTRAELAILRAQGRTIAERTGADTLVELGAGASEKTRVLLDALVAGGTLRRFVPLDVAETTLRATAETIAADYAGVEVHGVVADFRRHLSRLPRGGRRLVAFLGATIGQLRPAARADLLGEVAAAMVPGDFFLLGTDLVKDRERLVAAYDDAAGVTAEFNRNVLRMLNRELGADFDAAAFEYVACWDPDHEWIETHLQAQASQQVRIPALAMVVHFAAGETVRTAISAKFRRQVVAAELADAGLRLVAWWTDPAGEYALSLAAR